MTEVLVVGAGPVGLTLACELARHGARCRIIDRLTLPSPYCRAIGVTPRTLEVWEDMGIAQEMAGAGLWLRGRRSIIDGRPPQDESVDLSMLPFAQLGLPQYETERVLTRHLGRLGITVERGVALDGLEQDADGVSVRLTGGGAQARFRYVVGCDGAHSAVRHALGIPFEGDAMPVSFMLGDVSIGWDLPYGVTFRAIRSHPGAAPDLFVAIPLPEAGRFRVTMIAPPELVPAGRGTGHGIQAETRGPDLTHLQDVADELVPGRPVLSDLRWSSLFRISMRLAQRYRVGRAFIAGDAAHIHPPTGGQGMNTGIQDAYNLAWKLALVLGGATPEALLDSYEAERRPVGAEVVARTTAASVTLGREAGGPPDRLADTQIRVSYRTAGWVQDDGGAGEDRPMAGDRAPDAGGLRRQGFGFPLRLFEFLRGTEHVLLAHLPGPDALDRLDDLALFAREASGWPGRTRLRVAAVIAAEHDDPARPGITILHDAARTFSAAYGAPGGCYLVRPDGYLGWRGHSWRDPGLSQYLHRIFRAEPAQNPAA